MLNLILFLCRGNAGRSKMAEAFFNQLNKNPGYVATSAGTKPHKEVLPEAIAAMKELGIDISRQKPRLMTEKLAKEAFRIYSMGCDVTCDIRFAVAADWGIEDPFGRPLEEVRAIRDAIRQNVAALIEELEN